VMKKIFFMSLLFFSFMIFLFGNTCAGERFIDNGDGTVTDTNTDLMWASADNMGDIDWHDAVVYCKNPPVAGYKYSDWRMPTIKELKALFNKGGAKYESDCGLNVRIYPVITLSCAWVWASESKAISAYTFSFRKGYQYMTLQLNKKNFRALPVRTVE